MLFFLNLDGTVTRSDTDHVYQGQNKVANAELFTLISPAQSAIQVAFTLPNGLTTTYAPMSYVGAYSVDENKQKQVHYWKLAVPYNVTELEGQVGVSFNVLLHDGTSGQTKETINQTTYTASFLVEYSALPIPPTTATEDELGQLLDLLDKYYAQNASLAAKQPFVVGTVNTNTLGANQQASVAVEQSTTPDSNGNYPTNFAFSIPKGDTGPQGIQGPRGLQGPKGADGASFSPVGTVSKVADLPNTADPGTAYFVGLTAPRDIYAFDVVTSTWVNQGPLQGPKGEQGEQGEQGPQGPAGPQGIQGLQGVGVKSITSGTPTVVNDKTYTPITITLTDNTTVDVVVSAENGKDGTSTTVDIVQATGQSESAVMSQKAVTDEFTKYVTTDTDGQEITSTKKFYKDQVIIANGIDIGASAPAPEYNQYRLIDFLDKNEKRIGIVGASIDTNKCYGAYLQAGNVASMGVLSTPDGFGYTYGPIPPNKDNSNKLATTGWVLGNTPFIPFDSDSLSTGTYRSTNLPSDCSLVYIEDRDRRFSGYFYKGSGQSGFQELYFITSYYTASSSGQTTLVIYKLQINGTKVEKTYTNLFVSSSGKVEVGTEYVENGTFYYKVLK